VAAGSVEQKLNPFPPAPNQLVAAFVIAASLFLQRGNGSGTVTSIDCRTVIKIAQRAGCLRVVNPVLLRWASGKKS
jgi:hypothetical protein